jgi:uncharacterized membrane protein
MKKMIIKQLIVFALIFALFFNNAGIFAASIAQFDKMTLLKLKPLPSERLAKKAEDIKNWKLLPSLLMGGLGLAIISANSDMSQSENFIFIENNNDYHRINQIYGLFFVLIGLSTYFTLTPVEVDNNTLNSIDLAPADREFAAYYKMKADAEQAKNIRLTSGLYWTLFGLGTALMSGNFENTSYRSSYLTLGTVFTVIGLVNYFFPGPLESEMQKMNDELRTNAASGEAISH